MPKRKSKLRHIPCIPKASLDESSYRAPYRLTMLIPNKPVPGTEDEFIHTRPIKRAEALEIASKYAQRTYVVSEDIDSGDAIVGEPVVRLPELLIAMESVPINSAVISFDDLSRAEGDLALFKEAGAHVLNERISFDREGLVGDEAGEAYVMGIVDDSRPQLDWTGPVPSHVADWVNLRFYAMGILNCCYIGRGAPTGVDLKEQADMMTADLGLLARFVSSISSNLRELPEMGARQLPAWQERILWESRLSHHYQKALKQSESFREFFHYAPLRQTPGMSIADEELKDIKQLLREMIYAYEKGEENNIPDVIWTSSGPSQMAEALDELGAISTIEAYLTGVPLEDIMA